MFLLKKYSAVLSVIALTFLMDFHLHELCAVGASDDTSKADLALKYPLTTEGMLVLKADSFEHRDEALLQELVDRYETKQLILSAEELGALSRMCKELAQDFSTQGKVDPDFSKAAEYYLKAEKLGDQTARKAYYGLAKK